jgi:hypothetical protein
MMHSAQPKGEILMPFNSARRFLVITVLLGGLVLSLSAPAEAQRAYQPLFDKFNFKAELSWVGLSTTIGLFSEELDQGATLKFEDDLNLGNQETIPSLDFEWQIAKRHRLAARWQSINRNSASQNLTEIDWGDETIPINSDIALQFDITQIFVDYTFYPWVKERWALGFGLGLRWLDLASNLSWTFDGVQTIEGSQRADVVAPLPYLNLEYRRLLSEHWRMILTGGWLGITIGDNSGSQWVARAGIEYLIGKRWSVGGSFNLATIDIDADDIGSNDDIGQLNLSVDMDIWDFSIFGRVRF